jgi:nucleotide-binding universal stress UspA family protein
MLEKILLAIDGSKHSQKAAEAGIELAKLTNGKVTALFVIDVAKEYEGVGGVSWNIADRVVEGVKDSLLECSKDSLKIIGDIAGKAGVPFETKTVEGQPAVEIMKMAENANMDLIVMGRLGRTGISRFLMGSVAEKVIRNSKVPVLMVH